MADTPIITSKDLTKGGAEYATDWAISGLRSMVPFNNAPPVRKWLDAREADARKLASQGADYVSAQAESSGTFQTSDNLLVRFGNWLKDLFSGLKDWILGFVDAPSVDSRNTLLSSIGVDSKGAAVGSNPFAALGADVAAVVQASTADQIHSFAGVTGMPKDRKEAIAAALDAYRGIAQDTYDALAKKYGLNDANKASIEATAKQAASMATGIDTKIFAASNAAELLDKKLPTKGLIASFVQAAATDAHTVTDLAFDSDSLKQTSTLLAAIGKQAPSAEALAAAKQAGKDQKLAAADASQPDGPNPVPAATVEKPKGKA